MWHVLWILFFFFSSFLYNLFFHKYVPKETWGKLDTVIWFLPLIFGFILASHRAVRNWISGDEEYYTRRAHALGSGKPYFIEDGTLYIIEGGESEIEDDDGNYDEEEEEGETEED